MNNWKLGVLIISLNFMNEQLEIECFNYQFKLLKKAFATTKLDKYLMPKVLYRKTLNQ